MTKDFSLKQAILEKAKWDRNIIEQKINTAWFIDSVTTSNRERDVIVSWVENYHDELMPLIEKMADALEKAESALKYYGGIDYDSDAYLDVFDCITRESESITDFNADKFSKTARLALAELEQFKKDVVGE